MDDTRGFALPWTVFGIALLGLVAGGGFLVSWLEVRASEAFLAGTQAFYVAEAGLATALAGSSVPASGTGSVSVAAGDATMTYRRLLHIGDGETLYVVASSGRHPLRGAMTTREVERVGWFSDAPRTPAALAATGHVDGSGATGEISGLDLGACEPGDHAGIASGSAVVGPGLSVRGLPGQISFPGVTPIASSTGIRWIDLVGGLTPPPVATVPPDPWPPPGPGWPWIRLAHGGPLGPAESGHGAIVALGDLVLGDGFAWDGLVVVGGRLEIRGDVTVRGGILAGLDPTAASDVDLGPGHVSIFLDSCAVRQAAAALVPLAAGVPGTWRERW